MMERLLALGAAAGAIASIWGVIKIAVTIREWAKKKIEARRERRNAPMKLLLKQMNDMQGTLKGINERIERIEEADRRAEERDKIIERAVATIEKKVQRLDEGVATLQSDRLNQAFEYYVEDGNPCPMSVKMSLTAMCEQYQDGGHNHLHKSYLERLEECPTK